MTFAPSMCTQPARHKMLLDVGASALRARQAVESALMPLH